MFSWRSFCSGALPGRRRSGLEPDEPPTFKWKSDGARHTARLLAVICQSAMGALAATSARKVSSAINTSLFSSGNINTAHCKASSRCSLGRSEEKQNREKMLGM
ncbi:hypothetical protein E2C01_032294 [Portunus trituberculatus]|uniref:Uncharacterized protein n=1 Tax=Portunus trituberculatus TaxID=210409 RepID=A0A5B7F0Q0_PORTR|nr:hypothetical protein [Portunus trituberculatus]